MTVKRTMIAQAGVDFSAAFAMHFVQFRVRGACERVAAIVAPEVESTAGGKQATQHIVLRALSHGFPNQTVGWVNVAEKRALLRTYDCLRQMHAQRFGGRPLDLDQASYDAFLGEARRYFGSKQIYVEVESSPPENLVSESMRPKKSGGRMLATGCLVLAIFGVLMIGVAAYVYFEHRDAIPFL